MVSASICLSEFINCQEVTRVRRVTVARETSARGTIESVASGTRERDDCQWKAQMACGRRQNTPFHLPAEPVVQSGMNTEIPQPDLSHNASTRDPRGERFAVIQSKLTLTPSSDRPSRPRNAAEGVWEDDGHKWTRQDHSTTTTTTTQHTDAPARAGALS